MRHLGPGAILHQSASALSLLLDLLYSAPAGPRGSGLHCVDSDWSTELPGTSGDVTHHIRATVFSTSATSMLALAYNI